MNLNTQNKWIEMVVDFFNQTATLFVGQRFPKFKSYNFQFYKQITLLPSEGASNG